MLTAADLHTVREHANVPQSELPGALDDALLELCGPIWWRWLRPLRCRAVKLAFRAIVFHREATRMRIGEAQKTLPKPVLSLCERLYLIERVRAGDSDELILANMGVAERDPALRLQALAGLSYVRRNMAEQRERQEQQATMKAAREAVKAAAAAPAEDDDEGHRVLAEAAAAADGIPRPESRL